MNLNSLITLCLKCLLNILKCKEFFTITTCNFIFLWYSNNRNKGKHMKTILLIPSMIMINTIAIAVMPKLFSYFGYNNWQSGLFCLGLIVVIVGMVFLMVMHDDRKGRIWKLFREKRIVLSVAKKFCFRWIDGKTLNKVACLFANVATKENKYWRMIVTSFFFYHVLRK